MKPLLHRRTFWKGVASGAAAMAALIMGSVAAVSLAAPEELSRGVRPTWEPTPSHESLSKPVHVTLPPCDTRGKDCVVFEEPTITFEAPTWTPFEAPIRTVPEPSSLWLTALAGVALARNALFAAATAAFVTLGRWLGMKEEDE